MENQFPNVRVRTVNVRPVVRVGVPVVIVPVWMRVVPVLVMVGVVLVVWVEVLVVVPMVVVHCVLVRFTVLVVFSTGGFALDYDRAEFPRLGPCSSGRLRC